MGDKSKIEWTEATWNPIVGCSIVSPGCTNCYAMKTAERVSRMTEGSTGLAGGYGELTKRVNGKPVWTGAMRLVEPRLLQPLRWKRPRTIFVNSMGDLFHESVPDEWIDRVFAVMALCPQHIFQVLTKRAERMRAYVADLPNRDDLVASALTPAFAQSDAKDLVRLIGHLVSSPLPNLWLGVSAEDQKRYDERKEYLRATPAAIRFLSIEPMLGPISLDLSGLNQVYRPIHWVIVGGESGSNARPMHPDWARSIRDQCQAAGVPFFFKQWGEHVTGHLDREDFHVDEEAHGPSVTWNGIARCFDIPGEMGHYGRVGKRAAGRILDGREHNEMPERANG